MHLDDFLQTVDKRQKTTVTSRALIQSLSFFPITFERFLQSLVLQMCEKDNWPKISVSCVKPNNEKPEFVENFCTFLNRLAYNLKYTLTQYKNNIIYDKINGSMIYGI